MEGEGEASFSFFSIFPPSNLLRPSSFSFDFTVLLYYSSRPLFTHSLFLSLAYRILLNFRTLVILLQVNFAFGDELETVCEGCYEIEDTYIFAWSSILGVGHYRWLYGPIC
jgi:hypothetical protein